MSGWLYDEPSAQWHRFWRYHPEPDPQRPGVDRRVAQAKCGLKVALVGIPENRPSFLTVHAGCRG